MLSMKLMLQIIGLIAICVVIELIITVVMEKIFGNILYADDEIKAIQITNGILLGALLAYIVFV